MPTRIPLYAADGELCDWISEKRMARLERLGLIQIIDHRNLHRHRRADLGSARAEVETREL